MTDPRMVFVTGLPRSGTSFVTRVLSECGLYVGRCMAPNDDNPHGFFENGRVKKLLKRVAYKGEALAPSKLRTAMLEVFFEDGWNGVAPLGFKDPKLVDAWVHFRHAFPGADWVIVHRNRERSEESFRFCAFARDMSRAQIRQLYDRFQDNLNRLIRGGEVRMHHVHPDLIADGDFDELEDVVRELKLTVPSRFTLPSLWDHALWNRRWEPRKGELR